MKNRRLSFSSLRSTAPRVSAPGIRRRPSICAASIALLAAAIAQSAHAASGTWTSLTSGLLWSDTTAWSGGTVADGTGFAADFSTLDPTTDILIHLDSARTISGLIFGDTDSLTPAGWTIDNNGNAANILTLGAVPSITVNALGTGKIATISTVVAGTAGLTKAGAGTLNLTGSNTDRKSVV